MVLERIVKVNKFRICLVLFAFLPVMLRLFNSLPDVTTEEHPRKLVFGGKTLYLPKGTQMGTEQVATILKVLPKNGNLLVWGLGYDSSFWHNSTTGRVVFIEDSEDWYIKIKTEYPYVEAYKIKFLNRTVLDSILENPRRRNSLDIRHRLPESVREMRWHVIIVDGPAEHKGRHQSLYTSVLLAEEETHIFLDDYERESERYLSGLFLAEDPIEIVRRPPSLDVDANEQAHFIQSRKKLISLD